MNEKEGAKTDNDFWRDLGFRFGQLVGEAAEHGVPADPMGAACALQGVRDGLRANGSTAALRVLEEADGWTVADILGMREHVQ